MLDLGHGGDEQKRCSIRIKHTGCEVVQLLNIGAAKMVGFEAFACKCSDEN